ncbi:hypothetical protein V1478_006451 [Vespula squamosa]|uniref:Uncharacterized protein n=1 Tax=Vespula squamosa TaxID=30214 RepID=A0ABD2B7Y0_VESSQ
MKHSDVDSLGTGWKAR